MKDISEIKDISKELYNTWLDKRPSMAYQFVYLIKPRYHLENDEDYKFRTSDYIIKISTYSDRLIIRKISNTKTNETMRPNLRYKFSNYKKDEFISKISSDLGKLII